MKYLWSQSSTGENAFRAGAFSEGSAPTPTAPRWGYGDTERPRTKGAMRVGGTKRQGRAAPGGSYVCGTEALRGTGERRTAPPSVGTLWRRNAGLRDPGGGGGGGSGSGGPGPVGRRRAGGSRGERRPRAVAAREPCEQRNGGDDRECGPEEAVWGGGGAMRQQIPVGRGRPQWGCVGRGNAGPGPGRPQGQERRAGVQSAVRCSVPLPAPVRGVWRVKATRRGCWQLPVSPRSAFSSCQRPVVAPWLFSARRCSFARSSGRRGHPVHICSFPSSRFAAGFLLLPTKGCSRTGGVSPLGLSVPRSRDAGPSAVQVPISAA